MSFARFGPDSDVYVYMSDQMECCGCKLRDGDVFRGTYVEMKEHLQEHVEAGHKVPDYCLERLTYEMKAAETIFGRSIPKQDLAPPERN